jgi:hypothetical protein
MSRMPPPEILQIYRDFLNAGQEAAFRAVEEEAARICADLQCPNVHLAIESLAPPAEVWWLTPYESEADQARVAHGYATNAQLMAALRGISNRKNGIVGPAVDIVALYNRTSSSAASWQLAGARFFVVDATTAGRRRDAVIFDGPDGSQFAFKPLHTQKEAEATAAAWGAGARVFAVRPYWGMPAKEWMAADPEFWKASPSYSLSCIGDE